MIKKLLTITAITAAIAAANADRWPQASNEIFSSSNGNHLLEISPANAKALTRNEGNACEAKFFIRQTSEWYKNKPATYTRIAKFTLLNPVAPVDVLIPNDGTHIVTIDDWANVGKGKNVIVIYNSNGTLIRRLSLADMATTSEINNMPTSTSSKSWHGGMKFDSDNKNLKVEILTAGDRLNETAKYREISIELSTGKITPPTSA